MLMDAPKQRNKFLKKMLPYRDKLAINKENICIYATDMLK